MSGRDRTQRFRETFKQDPMRYVILALVVLSVLVLVLYILIGLNYVLDWNW